MPSAIHITRGPGIESTHDVAVCIVNDDGETVFKHGDSTQKIFPRSAVKIMQAMPLVISGGADAFQLDERMLALTCASHSGEAEHVELVAEMLGKAGLSEADLECGPHWPSRKTAAYDLAGEGKKPSQLHNNCSGKHTGMLLYAKHKGYPTKNYVSAGHPAQRDIRSLLEDVTQKKLGSDDCGMDGCSLPACMFSLEALARGLAKLGTGKKLTPEQATAAQRLRTACANYPFYTAGTGRFDTKVMQALGERAYVKTGAEGVYGGILPELKLGFAVKCLDGAVRAAECVTANIIATLLPLDAAEKRTLEPLCAPALTNWRGVEVGRVAINADFQRELANCKP